MSACSDRECPYSSPRGRPCWEARAILTSPLYSRGSLRKWLWASRRLRHHHGPVGVWPLPSANGMSIWGRSSESVEGHGGREKICNPAQLASGISSDWLRLICSVTCRIGSLGQSLPRTSTLASKDLAHPFLFRSSSYCVTICLGN